jgi:hypothetical protein
LQKKDKKTKDKKRQTFFWKKKLAKNKKKFEILEICLFFKTLS